jgi:hypothetical protein
MNDLMTIILLAIIPTFIAPILSYIIVYISEKIILFMKKYINIKRLFFAIFYVLIFACIYICLINWAITY